MSEYTLTPTQSERIDRVNVSGTDQPTNEHGEPLCAGLESGQCGRTVDELGATCWQHGDD